MCPDGGERMTEEIIEELEKSPWLTIEAVILIVLGVAALLSPMVAGIATSLVFAMILLAAGAVGLISAFAGKDHSHQGWSIASAVIALLVGTILVFNPPVGAAGISLFIAAYLLFDGFTLMALGVDHRGRTAGAWGWLFAAGVLDIVLGGFIAFMTAKGAVVFIGVIVGIDMIAAGVALLITHRWRRFALGE